MCQLVAHQGRSARGQVSVCRVIEPAARARGMWQRNHRRAVLLVAAADARREAAQSEQTLDRESADRDDQPRAQDRELPLSPEGAQLLFAWGRRSVAPA